jgi:hypothetical protein
MELKKVTLTKSELEEIQYVNAALTACEGITTDAKLNHILLQTAANKYVELVSRRAVWFENVAQKYTLVFTPANSWEVDFQTGELRII